MTEKPKKRQTRLSRYSFAAILKEMQAGPSTVSDLQRASGMTSRYLMAMLREMRKQGVAHVSGWEKDAIGRVGVAAWSLGAGKDARRPNKPRQQVNRDYRASRQREPLKGTPFYGLGA